MLQAIIRAGHLEIVERLCSHLAIIHRGRLVAQGSLDELRTGVEARLASQSAVEAVPSNGKLTLEQIFLATVGESKHNEQELSWLG